ncbi:MULTISPECIES: methyltransferase domain-containing protein [unclassified Streptomyces]|uniref:methyltransferase domain-containing protein n=1 Tax=unclassified Streptomyces TaxID=2593676 RepID=UPI00202433BD|nr:methyltransferase domain-containing protein [Streptomyces sp. A 4/2]WSV53232.1 methyltransferase domain-containing protein [Streptomyces sp. NBC_01014]
MNRDLGAPRPDQAAYMLRMAGTGRTYKEQLLALLDVRAGQTALDVGCGPGADLGDFSRLVGAGGRVIGVDRDPAMVAEARRRASGPAPVEIREGDAHALPVEPGSVDRARIDRVLMHVDDPAAALGALHRAVRPGGLVGLAEPDWDTLVVDADDLETGRAFTRFTTTVAVRNATIGRRLARLAEEAGFTVLTVLANTPVLRDPEVADYALGLGRNTRKAIDAGHIDEDRGTRWFESLSQGPFLASCTVFTVICSRGVTPMADPDEASSHI